jgi:hypothetical protein
MTPLECRLKAAEMREYARKNPIFAKQAEHIAAQWEKAARELEVRGASVSPSTATDEDQAPDGQ